MSLTWKWKYGLKSASFVVIMLLNEGLTQTFTKKPWLLFGESFTFNPMKNINLGVISWPAAKLNHLKDMTVFFVKAQLVYCVQI